ncbi:MAG: hypothetical protein CFE26_22640 [Verrucomicrobiales bacterium VVV1]|nr:MAG: hypothetical protein CFE26_22640 [Verrucomicrobiales bacterium VVV1]
MSASVPFQIPALPASLRTATPAEGHELARQLAAKLFAASVPATDSDMPAMLRTPEPRPSLEAVTAIYFHAISVANSGWTR